MVRFMMRSLAGDVIALLVLTGLTASASSAEIGASYVKNEQGQRPEPIVAVANVCAWPNLTLLRGGTIVAVGFNQPSHGGVVGDIDCWASVDGGQTWQKRGTPAPHDRPVSNRVNHAAGLANNGDLIVVCSGTTNINPPRRFQFLQPWISRSTDGGRTWSVDKRNAPTKTPDGEMWIPFGDIVPGNDGALRLAVYAAASDGRRIDRTYVLRSPDDGKTWGQFVQIDGANRRNETALLHLGGGRWLAAARGAGLLSLYASGDDAKTWVYRGQLTAGGRHPGHMLRLRDGGLLLSYGNRTGAVHGVEVLVSDDEGKTWSDPIRVMDWQGDGGYPSSIQRADGQIVTAYYARKIKSHDGYHMGVVIWDPKSLDASGRLERRKP